MCSRELGSVSKYPQRISGTLVLVVHNVIDLQVVELAGLLGASLEVVGDLLGVVGQVEVRDILSEVILCPCLFEGLRAQLGM